MQELKLGTQAGERKKELAAGNAAAQNSFRYWHRATLQDAEIRLTGVRFAGWRSSIATIGWCHKTGGSTLTRNLPFGSGPSLIVPHRKLFSGLACGQTVLRRSVLCRTDRSKLDLQAVNKHAVAGCQLHHSSGKSTACRTPRYIGEADSESSHYREFNWSPWHGMPVSRGIVDWCCGVTQKQARTAR